MKVILTLLACFVLFPAASQNFKSIFKSSEWLSKNLENENLVLLHVEAEDAYKAGHIPNAQYIGRSEYAFSIDSLSTQLPQVSYLDSLFTSKGISDESIVVLYYGSDKFAQTFRLYYTFDYVGLSKNVFILDGGLHNWTKEERPISTDAVQSSPAKGTLSIVLNGQILASKESVQSKLDQPNISIIDARTAAYYSGEKDGDGHYKRPGHIKNAKNITWLTIIDEDQMLKPKEVLGQFYEDEGIAKNDEIITYCHVGLRASVLYTVSKALGYKTSMYDGSINEWDRLDDQFPVQNTYKKD